MYSLLVINCRLRACCNITLGEGGKAFKQLGLTTLSVLTITFLCAAFMTLERRVDVVFMFMP